MGTLIHKNKNYSVSSKETQDLLAVTVAEQISLGLGNIRLRETLRLQSTHDPLTNLYNRRYLENWFIPILRRCRELNKPSALIMMDIDYFKKFNNKYGHEIGDTVLRKVGEILKNACRKNDIACRFGGEEFILALPNVEPKIAFKRAEEIRKTVSCFKIEVGQKKLDKITISSGIATFPYNADTANRLIIEADKALYQAKEQGRNQTVMRAI